MAKGVYASGELKFELSFDDGSTFKEVKDVTSLNFSGDQNKVEWTPFNEDGFMKNYITNKSITIGIEKQYNPADDVDKELIALLTTKSAYEHNYVKLKITEPIITTGNTTNAVFEAEASITINDAISQGSEDIAPLNFELAVNGKPTYTAESA